MLDNRFSCPPLDVILLAVGPLQTNTYIVFPADQKKALLIDPAEYSEEILAALRKLEREVGAVLLTHGHCDHVGGAARFAGDEIPLMIHEADAPKLGDPVASGAAMFGLSQERAEATRLLKEGDEVDIWGNGAALKVLHTPGHSKGSIALYREGCLFGGDLLFAGGIGRTDLPGGDDGEMMASLARILELPDETTVFPGHGPPTSIGAERRTNPFLAGLR